MHPSGRRAHPYSMKDVANTREGCTHAVIADIHEASWSQASRQKALALGLEACGHAASWSLASGHMDAPFRELGAALRPDGHKEIARRVHPCGERAAAIGSDGLRQMASGRIASRGGPGHAPSSTRGSAGGLLSSIMKDVALGAFEAVMGRRGVVNRPDGRPASRAARRDPP
jgi:hypothetical protein